MRYLPCFILLAFLSHSLLGQEATTLQEVANQAVALGHTPGIVLGLYQDDGLQLASAGVRKVNSKSKMTIDDQMHLGSCTKAFTATLIARLVEKEKLEWDSTIAKILPEVVDSIHEDFHNVTIEQLLFHTAGVPANAREWWIDDGENITERRTEIVKQNLQEAPKNAPGTKYLYSNLGYMIAGLMAAKVAEVPWEEALRSEVFEPLEITTAGFGIPGTEGETDQPWGHELDEDGELVGIQADNAPALGPAGTVYLSVADWNKFANIFLTYPDDFLEAETIQRLVTPGEVGRYAMGWGIYERRWAKGSAYTHAGSNTMWYANIWIAPEIGCVFLVAMNNASEEAAAQADALIGDLIGLSTNK